jgi:hypothetical protein
LPDWGQVVQSLDEEPLTVGRRWICPCLANHWQINWYRTDRDDDAFLHLPIGSRIEVVMGAQLGTDGLPKAFRHDPDRRDIREQPLPDYLASVAPRELRSGVEIRRWVGIRTSAEALNLLSPDEPVFILAFVRGPIPNDAWNRFLTLGQADARGVVAFKECQVPGGVIQSLLAPADALNTIGPSLCDDLGVAGGDLRYFALSTPR